MPEVGTDYFKQFQEKLHEERHGTEPPARPAALDAEPVTLDLTAEHIDEPSALVPVPQVVHRPPSLRNIDLASIQSRAHYFAELAPNIPLNEYALPRFFYRPDILVVPDTTPTTTSPTEGAGGGMTFYDYVKIQENLDAATIKLDYHHGYPTYSNGMPFWTKMDWEPREAFDAFTLYLQQQGARTFEPLRGYAPNILTEWYHLYFWAFRARSFDMFKTAHVARMREQRIFATEDDHYAMALRLEQKILNQLDEIEDEFWQEVGPANLVGMLEKVAKLRRVSAGLSSTTGVTDDKRPSGVSVELHMREVARRQEIPNQEGVTIDSQALLQDPDLLLRAQELIVKVTKSD